MGSPFVACSSSRKKWLFVIIACGHGTPPFVTRIRKMPKVSSPGIEPGLRPSQSRVRSGTLQGHVVCQYLARESNPVLRFRRPPCVRHTRKASKFHSSPSRNRTWSNSFGSCHAIRHTHGPNCQYLDLESNQDPNLRRVRCVPLHHRDKRADDWIRTSINRFTRAVPFYVEPRRQFLIQQRTSHECSTRLGVSSSVLTNKS